MSSSDNGLDASKNEDANKIVSELKLAKILVNGELTRYAQAPSELAPVSDIKLQDQFTMRYKHIIPLQGGWKYYQYEVECSKFIFVVDIPPTDNVNEIKTQLSVWNNTSRLQRLNDIKIILK